MKTMILIGMMMTTITAMADVDFRVNSSVENLTGKFKTVKIVRKGNKIVGLINVKSMVLDMKKDKRNDLLEYFNSKKHPTTNFKAEIKGGAITGKYELKGKMRDLKGIVNGNKATFKIPLTDLVTGFRSMFLSKGDHVELSIDLK